MKKHNLLIISFLLAVFAVLARIIYHFKTNKYKNYNFHLPNSEQKDNRILRKIINTNLKNTEKNFYTIDEDIEKIDKKIDDLKDELYIKEIFQKDDLGKY